MKWLRKLRNGVARQIERERVAFRFAWIVTVGLARAGREEIAE